ncbi:MAG: Gfo/Idh/MocA family oxidoreductase [Anaerolineales bacterium]|nr:Gfo/Idh/MocA family oxidoreductase [Anaerolineales bacterium]
MSERVRIGFVGVGHMGQCAHLRNYAALPDCEVVALAELRPVLREKAARKYGVPRTYASATEMLAAEQLDGIVAAQPFTRHGAVLPELYAVGVPVMSEKPLAGSVEVGERLLETLAQGGSWHMVGYHKRSDPATMAAKREIDRLKSTGELGPMRYVRITMPPGDWVANGFFDVITDQPPQGLAADLPASDMNAEVYEAYISFVNYYIHQVNLLRHLLGEPYRVTYAHPSGVLLAVESESGVAGAIEMAPYETTVSWEESALVAFQHGYVRLDLPAPLAINRPGQVEFMSDRGNGQVPSRTAPIVPMLGAMQQQARNFVAAVRGDMAPLCQAAEALEDLRVAREYLRLWKGA